MQYKKQIIVTGTSSGIGKATAVQLLNDGYSVVGIARNHKDNILEYPNFHSIELDLSDLDSLPQRLVELVAAYPDVQGIVFNAGKGQFGSLEEFSYSQIKSLMELNFVSHAYLAKAYLPKFKQRGYGNLVFIGSESALKGGRKGAVYCASKFALRGFSQSLRDECSKNSIRVTLINPGMVKGSFFDELDFEPGAEPENYLLSEDVANAISYVFAARPEYNVDEINLSPLKNVVQHKKKQ